jgi:hypothetical protein
VRADADATDDDWYADENSIIPKVITMITGIRIAVSTSTAPRSRALSNLPRFDIWLLEILVLLSGLPSLNQMCRPSLGRP